MHIGVHAHFISLQHEQRHGIFRINFLTMTRSCIGPFAYQFLWKARAARMKFLLRLSSVGFKLVTLEEQKQKRKEVHKMANNLLHIKLAILHVHKQRDRHKRGTEAECLFILLYLPSSLGWCTVHGCMQTTEDLRIIKQHSSCGREEGL
jgi:hypothetical protein